MICDSVGNRLIKAEDGALTTYAYDAANQLETADDASGTSAQKLERTNENSTGQLGARDGGLFHCGRCLRGTQKGEVLVFRNQKIERPLFQAQMGLLLQTRDSKLREWRSSI